MKKKLLTLILATTMVCGLFTACGGNESENVTNSQSGKDIVSEKVEVPDVWNSAVGWIKNEAIYNENVADRYVFFEREGYDVAVVCGTNNTVYTYVACFGESPAIGSEIDKMEYSPTTGCIHVFYEETEVSDATDIYYKITENGLSSLVTVSHGKEKNMTMVFDEEGNLVTTDYTNMDISDIVGTDFIEIKEWYTDIESAYKNRIIFE